MTDYNITENKRKEALEDIKNDIKNYEHSDNFYSDQFMTNAGYIDFYFIHDFMGKEMVFSGTLTTTRGDYLDRIDNECFENNNQKYIPEHGQSMLDLMAKKEVTLTPWYVKLEADTDGVVVLLDARINKNTLNQEDVENFVIEFKQHGLDVFKDKDQTPFCKTADELGLALSPIKTHLIWVDGWSHNTVGLDIKFDEE